MSTKRCRIPVIAKQWLAAILVLALLPSVAMAKDTLTLDEQLIQAAGHGDIAAVKSLLDQGADVNAKDRHGVPALWLASKMNHPDIVRQLLERGADVNAKDRDGVTALMAASSFALSGGKRDVVRQLLEKGADVDAKDKSAVTALIYAAGEDDPDVVRLLLDKGADVNAKDKDGKTALIWASKYGQLEHVSPLLDKGADPNAKDDQGKTALIWAAGWGDVQATRRLLEKGSDVNAKDNEGITALKTASDKDHTGIVELLKARGAREQADNEYLSPGRKAPAGPCIIREKAKANNARSFQCLEKDQPFDITSNKFTSRPIPIGKEASFEGNVRLKQGGTTLTCDRLVILFDEKSRTRTGETGVKTLSKGVEDVSQIKSITASGNVKIIQNERMTVARKVICDIENGTITIMEQKGSSTHDKTGLK